MVVVVVRRCRAGTCLLIDCVVQVNSSGRKLLATRNVDATHGSTGTAFAGRHTIKSPPHANSGSSISCHWDLLSLLLLLMF